MNKRGSADSKIFFVMWELLAAFMALVIILVAVRGVVNNNTYWKTYYSRDLGLMADIENVNQGDFVMNYVLKPRVDNILTTLDFISDQMFEISLTQKAVEVYDYPKEESKYPTTYPFAKHKNINVISDFTSSNFLVMSKIGDEFKISDYAIETADVCPSYDTSKDTKMTRFYSIYLDDKVKSQSESIKAVLGVARYGANPNATNESTIILGYGNFSIYYSDDQNTLLSQKMSCIIKTKFYDAYNYTPEIKKYDGSMDTNPEFSSYIANKESQEYWVMIMLSDNETKIGQNEFAAVIDKSIIEYYK
jgi:hypothetical protein